MRRTLPKSRGVMILALTLVLATSFALAADTKRKKKNEPPPPKSEETIGSLAYVITGHVNVEGVGLVIGLTNTGSNPPPSPQRSKLLNEMRKAGVEHPEKILERSTVSMVIVKATLPHGVSTSDPIDVDVELPPGSATTSLANGRLLMTDLQPVVNTDKGLKEGKVLAVAGGPIMTGDVKHPKKLTIGTVLGGGRVKNDIPYNLVVKDDRKSARTTKLIQDTIALRFHASDGVEQKGLATAKTDNLIVLKVPKVYHHNQNRYFQVIQNLAVVDNPGLRAQRMQNWGKQLLDPKTAGQAALKLEGVGQTSIPFLKEGLASTDSQVKFFSAEALAYLGNVDSAAFLAETAIKRPEFRSYALKALAAMDQSAGLMQLRELMAQADVELRYGAFDALRTFDPTDPFLGQVTVLEQLPLSEEERDITALQIDGAVRRRPRPKIEEPFKLYVVDCGGPPLVHIARNLRAEVVVFGRGLKLLTPVVLGNGGAVLLNASEGDNRVQVSRITNDALDGPDNRVTCSLNIVDIIQQAARLGATYPEVVEILTGAFNQKNLPGPLVADAIPLSNKAYSEAQLLGLTSKKDDAVKKASGKDDSDKEKKQGMLGRFLDRFKD